MWAVKQHGEGARLHEACVAMCAIMKQLGIAIDGGKDSLSMTARLRNGEIVNSPGQFRPICLRKGPVRDLKKMDTVLTALAEGWKFSPKNLPTPVN